jgi:hypothetical protein
LIGEAKYNLKQKNMPIKLSRDALEPLGLNASSWRQVPLTIHLAEVLVPLSDGSRFSVIKANYPPLFTKLVKCLSLFKK